MNPRRRLAAPLTGAVCLALFGCATTNPRQALGEVNRSVAARLGPSAPVAAPRSDAPAMPAAATALLSRPLTAEAAATIAVLCNPVLQSQLEDVGIAQVRLAQASRLPNPRIAGSWRFPDGPPSATDAEYSLTGDVLDLLTFSARKGIAGQALQEAEHTAADHVLRLVMQTETAFYRMQGQLEIARRLHTIVAISDAAADFARRQYAAGNINALDLHNEEASAAQVHLDWMAAEARAAVLREEVNRDLGLTGDRATWRVADKLPPLPPADPALKGLQALALRQRLDLAAARSRADAFAAALRLKAHTRLIPGLSVGVDTERTPDGQRVTGPSVGLELPLFDQGQPEVARLATQYQQAQDEVQALAVSIQAEVRAARATVLARRQMVEYSAKQILPLRAQILDETLRQYNAMQKSTYDLLLARQSEESAVTAYVTSLRDYWVARVALDHAVGGHLAVAAEAGTPSPASTSHQPGA